MSLILRKICQETLNSFSLHNVHVGIHKEMKHLQILGECGEPLVNIHGITFTRLPPSLAEINYCNELLQDFLDTHLLQIKAYFTELVKFKKLTPVELITEVFVVNEETKYSDANIRYTDYPFEVRITKKKQIVVFRLLEKKDITYEMLTAYKFNKDLLEEAIRYMFKYFDYAKQKKKLNEIKLSLSKCDI